MRISDWSSDVCFSDLADRVEPGLEHRVVGRGKRQLVDHHHAQRVAGHVHALAEAGRAQQHAVARLAEALQQLRAASFRERSEEHTPELQLLMRISYAVFYLTNKISPHSPPSPYTHYSTIYNSFDSAVIISAVTNL